MAFGIHCFHKRCLTRSDCKIIAFAMHSSPLGGGVSLVRSPVTFSYALSCGLLIILEARDQANWCPYKPLQDAPLYEIALPRKIKKYERGSA